MLDCDDDEKALSNVKGFPQWKIRLKFLEITDAIGQISVHLTGGDNQGAP